MFNEKKYVRTDLALEFDGADSTDSKGLDVSREDVKGFEVTRVTVSSEDRARLLGKPVGRYINVSIGKLWLDSDGRFETAAEVISAELKKLCRTILPSVRSVLTVGLGNRDIVSDALGPLTVKGITVTRHVEGADPMLFDALGGASLSAIAPGVTGQTGFEAAELVKCAVSAAKPSLVICVDALAAKDPLKLGTAVQLSDTGIAPGSGIGNGRLPIDRSTLGVPVISLGVPMVVDSSTLVCNMLERAGINGIPPSLERELENGKSFFVTLKDADTVVNELSRLIGTAIVSSFPI